MTFTKVSAFILTIILCLSVLPVALAREVINAVSTAYAHAQIKKEYCATEHPGVYIGSEIEFDSAAFGDMLNQLPEVAREEILRNWYIVISNSPIYGEHNSAPVAGTTNARTKVIWLREDLEYSVLVHEVGHAMAAKKDSDYSEEFQELCDAFVKADLPIDDKYSAYHTSSSSELFAFLFEMYVISPEELKLVFADGYNYMDTFVGGFNPYRGDSITKSRNWLSYKIKEMASESNAKNDVRNIEKIVKSNPLITLNEYQPYDAIEQLNANERLIASSVVDAICNPQKYTAQSVFGGPIIAFEYSGHISLNSYFKIAGYVDFWLGVECSGILLMHENETLGRFTIAVDTEKGQQLLAQRNVYENNVECVLAQMHEGTETEKLLQISKYIVNNSSYAERKKTSCDDFWTQGTCDDMTYAIVFKHFCERIGIRCDVIVGESSNGEAHVWNRVRLADGTYRYYDLAYCEQGRVNMTQYRYGTALGVNAYVGTDIEAAR